MLSICPILEGKVLHLKQTCFPSTQDCLVQSLVETGQIVLGEKGFQCCQFIFIFFNHLSLEARGPRALIITWLNCKIIKYCKKFKHQEFNHYMTNLNIIIKWDPVVLTCTDYNIPVIPIFISKRIYMVSSGDFNHFQVNQKKRTKCPWTIFSPEAVPSNKQAWAKHSLH